MKRYTLLMSTVLAVACSCLAWVGFTSAHSIHTGTNVSVNTSEPIRQTVFAAGRTVDIHNEIYGDIFCAGQTVHVSGKVHGDVMCAGQSVDVSGEVDGDVRLAGQTVTLSAKVSGNATIGGQNFTLTSDGEVKGDATVGSADAVFNGMVGRDLAVGGNSVLISGTIGRDIKGEMTALTLNSGAKIGGGIEYTSKSALVKQSDVTIGGKVSHTLPNETAKPKRGALWGFGLAWFFYWLAAIIFMTMSLALLFPNVLNEVTQKGMPWPWKALLVGFLTNLAMPVVFVLLVMTFIGIPLALLLAVLWLVIALLSTPVTAFYVGRRILGHTKHTLLVMLVGSSVLVLTLFLPFIGALVALLSLTIGTGMLVTELVKRTPKPDYQLHTGAKK